MDGGVLYHIVKGSTRRLYLAVLQLVQLVLLQELVAARLLPISPANAF